MKFERLDETHHVGINIKEKALIEVENFSTIDEFVNQHFELFQRLKLLYSNYLKTLPLEKSQKVDRNDPCPCGSGKKYKKCCGLGDTCLA